ncbi:unnamed protein product [Dovyalis caffra]|uniref:Uncharacterized protein n=1 Tax=Dovyalis caffra TaxID=77055 RepID=A0AAV1RR11_9ROSI|nr:unnamed protein product [Dovyalis caffra]
MRARRVWGLLDVFMGVREARDGVGWGMEPAWCDESLGMLSGGGDGGLGEGEVLGVRKLVYGCKVWFVRRCGCGRKRELWREGA